MRRFCICRHIFSTGEIDFFVSVLGQRLIDKFVLGSCCDDVFFAA
jgi:hypothetical protein